MTNGENPDQLASEEKIWIYTVCKGWEFPGSAGPGLNFDQYIVYLVMCLNIWTE